jgi:hypothetical protein
MSRGAPINVISWIIVAWVVVFAALGLIVANLH